MSDYTQADGRRICPVGQTGCWWIESGNPHEGQGHGCVCLVPVRMWTDSERDGLTHVVLEKQDAQQFVQQYHDHPDPLLKRVARDINYEVKPHE